VVTLSTRDARLWDTGSGKLLRRLPVGRVVEASFGPDGDKLVLATNRSATLWDPATGERIMPLTGRGDVFRNPRFSPDGALLAAQTADGSEVRVWDTFSGALRRRGFGPGSAASGERLATTAFSTDGRQLLTAYNLGRIRVWDVASGQLLIEPPFETLVRAYVADVAYTADRTRVSVLSEYSKVFTYECPLCASTPKLLELSERRVSDEIKRNARELSLQ
jgi:WD40 repeat protein